MILLDIDLFGGRILDKTIERLNQSIDDGELSQALEIISKYMSLYENDAEFLKAEARLCLKAGEYKTAISILKKAEIIAADDGEIYYLLVQAYEQCKGLPDEYGDVIEINTDNVEPAHYKDKLDVFSNRAAMHEMMRGKDAPLVSIYFLAYNNLEKYTKPAIEALLKYTEGIDYELLLVDNGSTDGTLEYFKSIPFEKKRIYHITKNIGALFGFKGAKAFSRGEFLRGKYMVTVNNDILVTKDWLKNMLRCAESDNKIGAVVPVSNYVSNRQCVDLGFTDVNDMQIKAAAYNVSDPRKWEERLRIIPTVILVRAELFNMYEADYGFVYYFTDDDLSIVWRRFGYRLMVCGDTFVYHAGSVGHNPAQIDEDLRRGREIYKKKHHGIDAWDDMCGLPQPSIHSCLKNALKREANCILGIDVGCGADLLVLKNELRKMGMFNCVLSAYTQDAKYWLDLKTICDGDVYCQPIEMIHEVLGEDKFDYILLGKDISEYDGEKIIDVLKQHLTIDGRLIFNVT